jgi:hypothetical protein
VGCANTFWGSTRCNYLVSMGAAQGSFTEDEKTIRSVFNNLSGKE